MREHHADDLTLKITTFLLNVSEEVIEAADEPGLLTPRETQALRDRALRELCLDRRVQMWAQSWIDDIREYSRVLVGKATNEKLRRATNGGKRREGLTKF
jgi:hypothetical protein